MADQWYFEPATRVRRGGSAAEYAFTPKLDVFVREVVQNAKDQKVDATVEVHFELIRLRGGSLRSFQDAIQWPLLVDHFRTAGEQNQNVRFLKRSVDQVETSGQMLLLRIDDSGTGGLTGGDLEPDRPFSSLCVDELFSVKTSSSAGGSYGLGKSVLWRFSQFSTVLFSSYPVEYPTDASGLRLFGRSQLPWHHIGDDTFDGTCWFGRRSTHGDRVVALSWWGKVASDMAPPLYLARPERPGTSILVVGFAPPADDPSPDESLPDRLTEAATDHFWPVLQGEAKELEVTATLVEAETGETLAKRRAVVGPRVAPFVQCLEAFRKRTTTEALDGPDDVAAVELEVKVPAKADGSPAVVAKTALCARFAGAGKPLVDNVAQARGFGMVVRYRELKGLSLSARHFHAVLLCGGLRGSSAGDVAVEELLRLAEPPEHNNWVSTPRLRDTYKRGYAATLDKLERDVAEALKRLVSQAAGRGEAGPDLLSSLFPIGERGRQAREHAFRVNKRHATLGADGIWAFGGEVERTKGAGAWQVRVQLRPAMEDGADGASVIGGLDAPLGCRVRLTDGRAEIQVPATVKKVGFTGRSDKGLNPLVARRVAVRLDVGAMILAHESDGRSKD